MLAGCSKYPGISGIGMTTKVEVVPDTVTDGMWVVQVNGQYITHEIYKGDADGMAARIRRALVALHPKEGTP